MQLFKRKAKYLIFIILLCFFILSINQEWYRLFPKNNLDPLHLKELEISGMKAIDYFDIPVSSIVIYKNKILGRGYNTVLKDDNAGGHAEINAISDALKTIGHDEFSKLDRDSLSLITTYEPCLMCKGAIINNRIKNVYFVERKGFLQHVKFSIQNLKYELYKRKSEEDTLQEFLFKKHPNYRAKK